MELSFDQDSIHTHNNLNIDNVDFKLSKIILTANASDHSSVLQLCENLFKASSHDFLLQVFAIQWAIAATEAIYDMPLRTQWIAKWDSIPSWKHSFWAQFQFNSQKAIGYFFEGALYESQIYFQICLEIAKTENYFRGIYRTLFNLGMIEKDRGNFEKSKEYLEQALIVAENNNSLRMIKKIKIAIEHLNTQTAYHQDMQRVLGLLTMGKKKDARSFIRKLFRLRKWEGIKPERNSDYLLMAIYTYNIKKMKSFNLIVNRIKDPIIKFQTYRLCRQMHDLPLQNQYEFDLLKKYFDIGSHPKDQNSIVTSNHAKYSADSNKLLNLLKNHPDGLSKEEITRILWKQQYDPLYHDSKIYKLVLKCRKEAKNSKVLINHYGIYKIGS